MNILTFSTFFVCFLLLCVCVCVPYCAPHFGLEGSRRNSTWWVYQIWLNGPLAYTVHRTRGKYDDPKPKICIRCADCVSEFSKLLPLPIPIMIIIMTVDECLRCNNKTIKLIKWIRSSILLLKSNVNIWPKLWSKLPWPYGHHINQCVFDMKQLGRHHKLHRRKYDLLGRWPKLERVRRTQIFPIEIKLKPLWLWERTNRKMSKYNFWSKYYYYFYLLCAGVWMCVESHRMKYAKRNNLL